MNSGASDGEASVQLPDDAEPITFSWWHNRYVYGCEGREPECAAKRCAHAGKWLKAISFSGRYAEFAPPGSRALNPMWRVSGHHAARNGQKAWEGDEVGHQPAIVLGREYGYFADDVDDDDLYMSEALLARYITRVDAISTRGTHWHALVWVPHALRHLWPAKGIPGADIKGAGEGFIPVPGSTHYSGVKYEPVTGAKIIIATKEMLLAIRDQPVTSRSRDAGYTGGSATGRQGDLLRMLMEKPDDISRDDAFAWWIGEFYRLEDTKDHIIDADPHGLFERQWQWRASRLAAGGGSGYTSAQAGWAQRASLTQLAVEDTSAAGDGSRASELELHVVGGDEREGDDGDAGAEHRAGPNRDNAGSPETPYITAGIALWRVFGQRSLVHWRDAWHYRNSDGSWPEREPAWIRALLYHWLADETYLVPVMRRGEPTGEFREVPWNPTAGRVTAVMDALAAQVHLNALSDAPCWLSDAGDGTISGTAATGLVPLSNGLLSIETGELSDHDGSFFCTWSLPFEYDASAVCPEWERYLASVLDEESAALLQEWSGYVVSGRTDLEKMMVLYGPPRSGKGTFAWVLGQVTGEANIAALSMASFGGDFALQPLLGKPLAVFDDARISRGMDVTAQMERLLSITGRGRVEVNRKNKGQITVQLPTRIMLMSNDLPEWPDAAGALPQRALLVEYRDSFLGREDSRLRDRFAGELPGIFNWAMTGYRRLSASGGFTQPLASTEAHQELMDMSNDVIPFVREHCVLGEEHSVTTTELFQAYALAHGGFKDEARQRQRFGANLRKAFPQIRKNDNAWDNTVTPRKKIKVYEGITLRNRLPDWAQL